VDIATLVGLVMVMVVLALQLLLGGSIGLFVNIPSMVGTFGGTMAALFINFSLPQILGAMKVAQQALRDSSRDTAAVIKNIVTYAEKARKEGMLALEEMAEREEDDFLRKGLRLAVDGTDPVVLTRIMEIDIDQVESRHKQGQDIFNQMGAYGPAFGMIGTLIGLVQMLAGLDDPSTIGAGMAVALLTTFYGAILANSFALPMAGKLKVRSGEEINLKWMMVEGIMAIQSGDSPRIVEEKLKSYMTPQARAALEAERARD
jgi:chemotaxis protein MotA